MLILCLFCGCLKKADALNTLQDYEQTFSVTRKTGLKGKKSLTIAEAGKIALENNPTLRTAVSSIKSAHYGYCRSLGSWFPEISAASEIKNAHSRSYDLHHPPAGIFPEEDRFSTANSVRASWLLFNGLARELDILIAKLEYDRSVAAGNDVRRILLRAVVYIWCDILLASEQIIIYNADKEFQNAALRQAEQQFKSGHISYASVLNFKILSAKAQSRETLARYCRETALNALASLLGYNSGEFPDDITLEHTEFPKRELHRPLHFYLEYAVLNRPDLKAEKIQFEKSLRQKQAVYAEFMPEIHLFADFSFGSAAAAYGDYSVNRSYYNHPAFSYGVTGTWNLFRGFSSLNELRRKKALEQAAFWGLNKKYLDVTAEVRDALEHCRNTAVQVGIYRSIANNVREQRDLIYSEYINGRETIARVNQAQSELVEAQNNLVLWEIESGKADAQLSAALGVDALPVR